jgi:hypothetical protein
MIFLKTIKKLFNHPKRRFIYAVTAGRFLGELLVYIKKDNTDYVFLSLPLMKNRAIPMDKFDFGIREKIVEVVRKIPNPVFKVCTAQYAKNVDDNNVAL